ncbi:hypothetical protein [Streptomyces sp. NPDC050485]|uniref:hypothetical protein n=1 Tax=Streptomyces sp. NPDC050485 TaxID=3365617 RepID=UPI0037A439E1
MGRHCRARLGRHPRRTHQDLLALDPHYRIESFSTKLGGLRLQVADRFREGEFDGEFADRVAALTDAAESFSEQTCELCGAPGRIRFRGEGPQIWMQSSCEQCRTRPTHPDRHDVHQSRHPASP